MAKQISTIILSAAIVIIGIIAFNQLHYWDRSTRIFKTNNEQSFRRGSDRGRPNFEGRENRVRPKRSEIQNLPDSVIQQQFKDFRGEQGSFENRGNNNERRHGNYRRGKNIQLRNVGWFLAVFSLFTVITIYFDKSFKYFRSKKKQNKN